MATVVCRNHEVNVVTGAALAGGTPVFIPDLSDVTASA
jgi:hypothetical protein